MAENLLSLIASGKLPGGTKLHHQGRRRADCTATATIAENGIILNGHTYSSPSGAARAVTGNGVNGWVFWKLPSGRSLGTLRIADST
jgi:site-specific DNA-methyltransferase (adenine-specific)